MNHVHLFIPLTLEDLSEMINLTSEFMKIC